MSELQLLILVAAIALATGFAIGGWIFSGRSSAPNKMLAPDNDKMENELFHTWRDPLSGRMRIVIQGKPVNAANELSQESLASFQQDLAELNRWAGKQLEASSASEAIIKVNSEQLVSANLPPTPTSDSKPTRFNPLDVVAQALRSDVRKPESHPASIAAQIDEILQEKLEADSTITRAVRLLEIPGKGMVVMVGLDQYAGVDEVPDADVRTLIREAVAEWERRVES